MAKRTCPACAEVVQAAAVKCKHCGTALPPLPKPKITVSQAIAVGFVLFVALPLMGLCGKDPATPEERAKRAEVEQKQAAINKEQNAIERFPIASMRVAKRAVLSMLKAPSTAELDAVVIDVDKASHALVLVQADAQNSFGAKIRSFYCVVTIGFGDEGDAILAPDPVRECRSPPTAAQIAGAKKRNGWK